MSDFGPEPELLEISIRYEVDALQQAVAHHTSDTPTGQVLATADAFLAWLRDMDSVDDS
jgi:hypothetical protein